MLFKAPLLILLALLSFSLHAQMRGISYTIHGTVRDSASGEAMDGATVSYWDRSGGVAESIRSRAKGFSLHITRAGVYHIAASYLGYLPDTIAVLVTASDSSFSVVNFRLRPSSKPLMEVIVKATIPPVIVKADTIGFNTAAYPTRAYATVEDLLRKLPGVAIDKDGTITMQGKKIDKILVDGKEFFLADIKTATQNFPAELVAQVEAFDTQSEQARLTGIKDNTGGKTLNIKLRKGRSRGYFGKLYAGAGNGDSYTAGGTAASLGGARNMFINTQGNNINNQFNGTENNVGPASGGIQSVASTNANYRDKFGQHVTAIANAGFYHNRETRLQSSNRQTFLGDSSLVETRASTSRASNMIWRANARFEIRLDSMQDLTIQSGGTLNNGDNSSSDSLAALAQQGTTDTARSWPSSRGQTVNSNHVYGHTYSTAIDFRRKGQRPGRTFYVGLNHSNQYQHQDAGLYSLLNLFDSTGKINAQAMRNMRSGQSMKGSSFLARTVYTEPVAKGYVLDIGYNVSIRSDRNDKASFNYDTANRAFDLPDSLTSNDFSTRTIMQTFRTGMNVTKNKFRYQLGIALQATGLDSRNDSRHTSLSQRFTTWYPRAEMIWAPVAGRSLQLAYYGFAIVPSTDQLQPLPDLTNPLLVKLGNPSLRQSFQHNATLDFSSFNVKAQQNWQLNAQAGYIKDAIAAFTVLLPGGVQQVQYGNINGNYTLSAVLTYGFPLWARKGNASAGVHWQRDHQNGLLNNQHTYTDLTSTGAQLKINCHPSEKVFLDIMATLDCTGNRYSLNTGQNTVLVVQNYTANASYEMPWSVTLSFFYNWQHTGAQGAIPSRVLSYWNAAAYKKVFHNRSGQIRLSLFNILNSARNISQGVGPNYIETNRINLIGRLWLLSSIWNFKKFPVNSPVIPPS
ncbi:MAG: hypothetical protein BGO55_08580 [Sphingobacteriales bacterium 50-39]|nr:outer membrane beta-barrel protein [Sphingobacteriales bacterium]OJW59319.1 MAG: hypothetical protein BGO55_08580 [Sphingobacteriales bacterium 50-39]